MLPFDASVVVPYGVMQWWYTAHAVSFVPCICICCAALACTANELSRNFQNMMLMLRLVWNILTKVTKAQNPEDWEGTVVVQR